jgi:hypothetical protein
MTGVGDQDPARPVQPAIAVLVVHKYIVRPIPDDRRLSAHGLRFKPAQGFERGHRVRMRQGRGDPAIRGVHQRNVSRYDTEFFAHIAFLVGVGTSQPPPNDGMATAPGALSDRDQHTRFPAEILRSLCGLPLLLCSDPFAAFGNVHQPPARKAPRRPVVSRWSRLGPEGCQRPETACGRRRRRHLLLCPS